MTNPNEITLESLCPVLVRGMETNNKLGRST